MKKTYKIVPFDIELAKKIQAGEIEGRVRIGKYNDVRIICSNRKGKADPIVALVTSPRMGEPEFLVTISNDGAVNYLGYESFGISTYEKVKAHIEILEEAEIVENGDYVEVINSEHLTGQKGVAEIMINTPFPFVCGINQGKLGTFYVYDRSKLKILKKHNEVTPKYEFKPFDKVLVRSKDNTNNKWLPAIYAYYDDVVSHVTIDHRMYAEENCILYEGNEHLVGTTDNPKEG